MNVRVLGPDLLTVHVRLQFEEQPKQSDARPNLADSESPAGRQRDEKAESGARTAAELRRLP
jgi:hypothetical protein